MLLGVYVWQANSAIEQQAVWRSAHEAKQAMPRADMQSLSGTLSIQPGDMVSMELDLEVQAPPNRSLSNLLFSFNPGFTVADVRVDGSEVSWTHQDGLLEITPTQSIAQGSKSVVSLRASGIPDEFLGYLDTYFNVSQVDFSQGQLGMLGFKASIFESTYVAMMPGAHWLPSTGTDVPQGDPRTHPNDYYLLDLEVEIPADWLVAGPGRRQAVSTDGKTSRYRFNPKSPLPHVGLMASRFERRAMRVADVEFEVLLYPGHDRNLKFFEDAQTAIKERLRELFLSAQELGLGYPYDGMSLVETPIVLRGYGGGWRMDTVQSMPGVMLLRENSFPTSRFELKSTDPEGYEGEQGGIGLAKLNALEQYFENDFSGGNLFTGGSRNFLQFQASAQGDGQVNYWRRAVYYDSWGKYRKTMALINPGSGISHAIFTASLPHSGRWRLSYYLGANTNTESRNPRFIAGSLSNSSLGEHEMTLVSNGDRRKIEFDGKVASFGWTI